VKPYQSYKPSGVPWLGNVPSHWKIKKVKHVVERLIGGATPSTSDPTLWDDKSGTPWVAIGDMSAQELVTATARKVSDAGLRDKRMEVLRPGTVIYSMYASVGYASILDIEAVTNQAILGMTNAEGMINRFLMSFLNSIRSSVLQEAASNTQDNLNAEKVRRIPLLCPPIEEQIAIANYLDAEITRIDELVREKEQLIGFLHEARASLVSEIISGEHLPGQPTGNEWAPHLPTGWELKKLKHLGQVRSGLAKGKESLGKEIVELPYLRVANVQDGHLDLQEVLTIPVEVEAVERFSLKAGDVLMNEGGDYDKVGRGTVWSAEISPCLHQNHVFAVRPSDANLSEWIAAVTQAQYAKFYFMNNAKQSTNLASISQRNIKELPILLPPEDLRDTLLTQLRTEQQALGELITHTNDEIRLLRELRAATIADAVLGRVDVSK